MATVEQKLAVAEIKAIMKDLTLKGYDRSRINAVSHRLHAFDGVPVCSPLGECLNKFNRLLLDARNGFVDYSYLGNEFEKLSQLTKEAKAANASNSNQQLSVCH